MQAKRYLKQVHGLSARLITKLKNIDGGITMDGELLRAVDQVRAGGTIVISLPEEAFPVKQHQTDTLANIVAFYAEQRGESYVFRAHNRLDRDTSGIVIIAKDKFTINRLKGSVRKKYYALVHGKISESGTVAEPIGLLEDSKIVRHVLPQGSPAVTHYKPLVYNDKASFLSLVLETGKTHQIRCHMSHLGHPLVGDDLYGGKREFINRQALHCGEAVLIHPVTGKKINLRAPLPEDIITALAAYNLKEDQPLG